MDEYRPFHGGWLRGKRLKREKREGRDSQETEFGLAELPGGFLHLGNAGLQHKQPLMLSPITKPTLQMQVRLHIFRVGFVVLANPKAGLHITRKLVSGQFAALKASTTSRADCKPDRAC